VKVLLRYDRSRDVAFAGEVRNLQDVFDRMREAGASFRNLDLSHEDLNGLSLRGLDFSDAQFEMATCQGTDFTGSRLTGARFTFTDLTCAVLDGCDLTGASFIDTPLHRASLRNAQGVPVLEDIHRQVYEAARQDGALHMGAWHACETTHCRAGWVNVLAGARHLEDRNNPGALAHLIYLASDPERFSGPAGDDLPDFYAQDDAALNDMARLAGVNA